MKRSIEELKQPSNKGAKASDGPPPRGVLMFNEEGEEKREEVQVVEDKVLNVRVLEFDDYNEVLVKEAESKKTHVPTMQAFLFNGGTIVFNKN